MTTTAKTTTTVDEATHTIRFERTLAAPREAVFEAWTRPEDIAQWWDPTGAPLRECAIDLRPGGAFKLVNQGHSPPFEGVYRVVDRPALLVFDALGSKGTVRLDAGDGNTTTRMIVTIECASSEHLAQFMKLGVHTGTAQTLDNLAAHVA